MILDISELMLGDWVKILNNKGEWIDNCKVDLNLLFSAENCVSFLEPIPLTPEIIEKNLENEGNIFGYKDYILNQVYTLENRGKRFSLVRKCNDLTSSTFWICDIFYVHELQHALKMFRIKKEIVL